MFVIGFREVLAGFLILTFPLQPVVVFLKEPVFLGISGRDRSSRLGSDVSGNQYPE